MADSADHNDQEEPIYEYTEPWWHDSYQGWTCAVSEANPQKKGNVQEETEETISDGKGKGKEKGKGKGRTYHDCGEQGHFARESPAPKGKRQGKNWLSPRQWTQHNPGFIPTGGKEIRKSRVKAQTNLMEKEVCVRHGTGRFVQLSTAGLREPHAVAA